MLSEEDPPDLGKLLVSAENDETGTQTAQRQLSDTLTVDRVALVTANDALPPLPDTVVERILDFLLIANHVEDLTNKLSATPHPNYDFSTSIMRVSKSFKSLSQSVFRCNDCILVSTTYPTILDALKSHRVWHRSQGISGFKDFRLWVHITTHPFQIRSESIPAERFDEKNTDDKKPVLPVKKFLILKNDLADFVYVLRVADMLINCHFNLRFAFNKDLYGTTPGPTAQEALLMPFTKLRGNFQKCVVNGADPELARRVTKLLTPTIHWGRARSWELMDLLMLKQSLALDKFSTGDFSAAALETFEAFELTHAARELLLEIMHGDDQCLRDNLNHWRATNTLNTCICEIHISLDALHATSERYYIIFNAGLSGQGLTHLTRREHWIWNSVLGIAYLGITDYRKSIKHFRDACANDASTDAYRYCLSQLEGLQQRTERGQAKRKLAHTVMLDLIAILDHTPLQHTLISPQHNLVTIDDERVVLDGLGYTGPLLEDRLPSATNCMTERVMDRGSSGQDFLNAQKFNVGLLETLESRVHRYQLQKGEHPHIRLFMNNDNNPKFEFLDKDSAARYVARNGLNVTENGFMTCNVTGLGNDRM